jgi:hypothetical protein
MGLKSYYSYGLSSFLVIVIALYLLFTGAFNMNPMTSALANDTGYAQVPGRHLTLVVSWKNQARTPGEQRESAFALA